MTKLPLAKKHFGQHFLINPKVIQNICQDFSDKSKSIIELGPGPGVLTELLVKHQQPLELVEIDKNLKERLIQLVPEQNVTIQDGLTISWEEFIQKKSLPGPVWLVSNLPYNVASPLMVRFAQAESIEYLTLMMQKEVGDKIIFNLPKNAMNSLGALLQTYFQIKKLMVVSPGSFRPPPKVQSLILSFERRLSPVIALNEFSHYEAFLRILFGNKRKQVGNILKSHFEQIQLQDAFEKTGICKNSRSETFTLSEVQTLYTTLTRGN